MSVDVILVDDGVTTNLRLIDGKNNIFDLFKDSSGGMCRNVETPEYYPQIKLTSSEIREVFTYIKKLLTHRDNIKRIKELEAEIARLRKEME